MSNTKKEHKVQVVSNGIRYVGIEVLGVVSFSRDGSSVGKAKWVDDQFLDSTAILPDDVILQMERLIKEAIDADYFD
ncbi:MAG: hypothetical protein ABJE95_06495 [Byssovorax sp.]